MALCRGQLKARVLAAVPPLHAYRHCPLAYSYKAIPALAFIITSVFAVSAYFFSIALSAMLTSSPVK